MGISAFRCRDSASGLCVHSPQRGAQEALHCEVTDGKELFLLCSVFLQQFFGAPLTPARGGGKARLPEVSTSQAVSSAVRPAGELLTHTAASDLWSPVLLSHASHSSPACWTPCS